MATSNVTFHPFLSAEEIDAINATLAQRISKDYVPLLGEKKELLVVVTLKGAMYFAADLIRKMTVPIRVDYVRAKSYFGGTQSTGKIELIRDIDSEVEDQHILVLDEIVDSGHTLNFLIQHFSKQKPASLKVCALLDKPSRREVDVPVDYIGKKIEDKFLIGYGLDFEEKYRNLKDIYYI